jgi:hypothetical protein
VPVTVADAVSGKDMAWVRPEAGENVPTRGTWRAVPALAAPIMVTAAAAPPQLTGHSVHAAGFVSPTTGWTVITRSTPRPMSWLLRTEDAGGTWTSQLAWPGNLYGRLRAFDVHRAGLVLGLWPEVSNEINGQPLAVGESFHAFIASTEDGGATWTLGSGPDPQGTGVYFLTTRQIWLQIHVSNLYPSSDPAQTEDGVTWWIEDTEGPRNDLARTEDGGATWSRIDGVPWGQIEGTGDLPTVQVAFSSVTDGLLIAADRLRADILYRTTDGGTTWTRQRLLPPPGLPARAETWLFPVLSPEVGNLLTLRAVSRRESINRPRWEGTYGYARTGDGWTTPYRLPMAPASLGHDLLVPGPDGRIWGASGRNVWVSDDLAGPWEHRRVPVPDDESVAEIFPVADGVLWLTTASGVSGGGLYRSDDDGVHWTRLLIAAT